MLEVGSAGGHIKKIRKFQITTKFRIILGIIKMPYIFDFVKIKDPYFKEV